MQFVACRARITQRFQTQLPKRIQLDLGFDQSENVAQRLGLQEHGMVRAGCACYTTADEVERLVGGVRELARA